MLLDTYVLIALATRSHDDYDAVHAFVNGRAEFVVSAISYVEVMGWPEAGPYDLALREDVYQRMVELPMDREILSVAASLRRQRRKIGMADAIIAATGLIYDLPVVTANTADFDWIEGLMVIDPRTA